MEYALPYILLCTFLGAMAVWHYNTDQPDTRNKISITCVLAFLIFFGFRGYVFDDWQTYYNVFRTAEWDRLTLLPGKEWQTEVGFSVLLMLCKSVFNNFQFFVFVCALINTCLLVRFFSRRISNIPLGIMLYISMGGLVMSTNLMRNSIAILLFINALEYLEQRRPIPYFVICAVAFSFHLSAIFYIPLYFFLHRNVNKWIFLTIFIIGNAILLFHVSVLEPIINLIGGGLDANMLNKAQDYANMEANGGFGISVGYLERLFTGILVFIYIDELKEKRAENVVFINSIMLYFLMIFMFSEFEELSKRMSNLFIFSYWIIWYDLIKTFNVKNNRRLFIIFIYIYCVLKIAGTARYVSADYDNVLTGAKSYQERLYIYNRYTPDHN